MGGNAFIKGWRAQPIPNTVEVITQLAEDVRQVLDNMSSGMKTKFVPSGSSQRIFNQKILFDHERRKEYGDIDVMFDQNVYDIVAQNIEGYTYIQHTHGGVSELILSCVAVQKTDQLITLWNWRDKLIIQIDFEPSEFVGGEPTEWAKFAHSSNDEMLKIKGVFHKHLLRALNAPDVKDVLILQKSGKMKTIKSAEYALSVSGLRRKLFPVMTKIENGSYREEHQLLVDGKLVYHESTLKDWIRDLDVIQAFYFGKEETHKVNKNQLMSFRTLADMIKETRSKNDQLKILNGFVNTLWGNGAQKLYRDNDEKDLEEKKRAFNYIAALFDFPTNLWDSMIDGYYGNEAEEYNAL